MFDMPDMTVQDFAFLSQLLADYSIQTIIEVGSFHGGSAVFFARHATVQRVICVDPFEVSNRDPWWQELHDKGLPNPYWDEFEKNIHEARVAHKIIPVRGYSYNVIGKVRERFGRADMLFIDANHEYDACKLDITLYAPLATRLLCGDDYGLPEYPGVRRAAAELLPTHQSWGRFWWVVK
jgi:hypothetical protein